VYWGRKEYVHGVPEGLRSNGGSSGKSSKGSVNERNPVGRRTEALKRREESGVGNDYEGVFEALTGPRVVERKREVGEDVEHLDAGERKQARVFT
jgi:hypothetical protein